MKKTKKTKPDKDLEIKADSLDLNESGKNESNKKVNYIEKINKFLEKYQRIKKSELIFLTKNLYLMIKVGIPLAEGLDTLALQTKNQRLKNLIISISNSIEKGETFNNAVSKFPKIFSHYFRSMIEVGEISGTLETSLLNIAEQEKKDYELARDIKGAMIYPLVIIAAMLLLGTGFFIFIVPTFISIFNDLEAELPLATKIIVSAAKFFINYGLFVLIFTILLIIGFIKLLTYKKPKRILAKILLKMPIFGDIIQKINILRFSRVLHSMIKTDIKIERAFKIASRTMANPLYSDSLAETATQIEKGESIAKTLKKYPKLFPAVFVQLIMVAENTGSLEETLAETELFYESEVDAITKNMASIIEPVLIVILGIGVAFLAIAVIMPMYSLSSHMSI